jgi:hypothetical protein
VGEKLLLIKLTAIQWVPKALPGMKISAVYNADAKNEAVSTFL